MMVKLKSKVNGAIETVKALYNNYGANREKAYWEKMPPELRSNLSTSCHLNKNATFGYKRGFLKEGACCNYYDASGNLKSKWLDSVYRSDVKVAAEVVTGAVLTYINYRLLNKFDGKYFSLRYLKDKAMSYFKSSPIVKSTLDQTLEEEEAKETPAPALTPAPTNNVKKSKKSKHNNNNSNNSNSRKKAVQKYKNKKL